MICSPSEFMLVSFNCDCGSVLARLDLSAAWWAVLQTAAGNAGACPISRETRLAQVKGVVTHWHDEIQFYIGRHRLFEVRQSPQGLP